MIEIILPIRLQSPNVKEHWTKTYKRNKRVAQVIGFTLRTNSEVCALRDKLFSNTKVAKDKTKLTGGFKIRIQLIKLGRPFDYDNMVFAFKAIRDSTCAFFFPKLAAGQADCQDCFDIDYLQEKGGSGIKILITEVPI